MFFSNYYSFFKCLNISLRAPLQCFSVKIPINSSGMFFLTAGNSGLAYESLGDLQSALGCQQKHLKIAELILTESTSNTTSMTSLYSSNSTSLVNSLSNSTHSNNVSASSLNQASNTTPTRCSIEEATDAKLTALSSLGRIHHQLKHFEEAVQVFHMALQLALQLGISHCIFSRLLFFFLIFEKLQFEVLI